MVSRSDPLRSVVIDDPVRLRGLADEWRTLLARSSTNELSVHPDWILPWWDVFGDSGKRSLRTLALFDGDRLVGLAPLLARPHVYRPAIPFRRLEALASGEDEADETCSDYLGLIAEQGREEEVASAFAGALTSGVAGDWDELVIPSMSGDAALPAIVRDELARRGLHVSLEERDTSPYVSLPKTWDEYLGGLKQSKRGQLRKALRALSQWAGGELPVIERVRAPSELAKGQEILLALHRERWAAGSPSLMGVYSSARYRAFQDGVMPRLLALGALDLGWISVRGEPVAAFYNFRHDGRVLHYQSGRKLDVPDDVRVGVTMHALLIRDAIEGGMREYDFLAGAAQYKMALANCTRPLVTLRAARPSVVESARRASEQATDQARRLRDYAKAAYAAKRSPSGPAPTPAPDGDMSNAKQAQGASTESAGTATKASKSPRVARALDEQARAMYFGPHAGEGRALFGWYHPARGGTKRGRAVVLCPPLGYEGICAYPALRTLAERLSAAGYPVLRFDYDGTGDSGGLDSDPGRVRAWIESVGAAASELRALSGEDEICLFGVRMGATLALTSAAERGDIERLVLWNPCPTGKAYARELRAFRLFAEQTGELAARPRVEGDASEESGGFLFTEETLKALKALDALKLTKRAAGKVLVIGRDDVPDDDKLARAIESHGAVTTYRQLPGYAEMMVAPHKSVFPEAMYDAMLAWLDEPSEARVDAPEPRAAAVASTAQDGGLVAPGVREEAIRFGPKGGFFGVLTEPVDKDLSRGKPLVIFSNTAGNYRIGPNRMYVEMGRKLAALGVPSARIDISGIGDSVIWEDEALNHPYADQLTDDVRALIEHLKARGGADRFIVAGLCSGAFVAYHAALADPAVVGVALINPQTFKWEEGMSLDVNPLTRRDASEYYKRRFFAKDAWLKMLKGGVNPRHAFEAVRGRIVDSARSKIARAKSKLSSDASRGSEVARAFDSMCSRDIDVLIVFSGSDPGIDNLNEKVGSSMGALVKRSNFTIETIEGPDHSFTPLWSQVELDSVLVGHLARRFV